MHQKQTSSRLMLSAICFTALLVVGTSSFAETSPEATTGATNMAAPTGNAPQHPTMMNPAIREAIKACAESVAKDTSGRPDHVAMDACMKAKGFEPPLRQMNGEHPMPPKGGDMPAPNAQQ